MDYVAIVDGYFLLGVNPQVFLEIPKDRTELEWCASAFLERIVQTNSLDDYFEEFQVVRAQLEGVAAYMSEELSEIFFLELFIAGMEEETKSYVQWIAPRTVLMARRHAKYHTTEGRRLAKYYQELKRGVEISSAIRDGDEVRGDGAGNHQVEQEEEGLTTHTTCSMKVLEETVHDAAEGEVETEHSNCLIKVLGENMDARLQLSITPSHLGMVNSYVQSNITIAYGFMCKILETVGCYQFLEMLRMFKALARSSMNKRLDGVDETRNDTLAYCIQLENSGFWPGSLCDLSKLLWDPGGIWTNTQLNWCNYGQGNLECGNLSDRFQFSIVLWDPGGKLKCTQWTSGLVECWSQHVCSCICCQQIGADYSGNLTMGIREKSWVESREKPGHSPIFGYDYWYQPWHKTMISTSWGAPAVFTQDFKMHQMVFTDTIHISTTGPMGSSIRFVVELCSLFAFLRQQLWDWATAVLVGAATTWGSLSSDWLSSASQRLAPSGLIITARFIWEGDYKAGRETINHMLNFALLLQQLCAATVLWVGLCSSSLLHCCGNLGLCSSNFGMCNDNFALLMPQLCAKQKRKKKSPFILEDKDVLRRVECYECRVQVIRL